MVRADRQQRTVSGAATSFCAFVCLLLALLSVLVSSSAIAQTQDLGPQNAGLSFETYPYSEPFRSFINREAWPDYWNYGKYPFTRNNVSVRSLELYDRMGTHLLRGLPLFSWRETRSDSVGLQLSDVQREKFFFVFFNNLVAASESYGGWSFGMTVGEPIRTSLTPLTLRTPRWQGLRLDGESSRQGFTMLMTRGALDRFSAFDARLDKSPVLAYGGHYYYKPSDVLTVGATLFNQHQVDVESKEGSFFSGTQAYEMNSPKEISVRIESDAPQRGAAAAVYAVDVDLVVAVDGELQRLSSDSESGPGVEHRASLEPLETPRGASRAGDAWVVDAPGQSVDYVFSMPANANVHEATFRADVAGDYRISVRQEHDFLNTAGDAPVVESRSWPSPPDPTHSQLGNPLYPYDFGPTETEPYYTVARAEGRPDLASRGRVSFDYGIPSGKTLLGTDFQLRSRELIANGEIVVDVEEKHFPFASDSLDARGKSYTSGSWAYMFNVRKPFYTQSMKWEWAGELFRMDPDYGGGYDSRRGGTVFFTDKGGSGGAAAFTQEFPLMEDNDDNDEYPDDTFPDQGRFQRFVPGSYSGGRSGGVYPGLDEDGDLAPDNDRDRNGVPDWTEPFLLFDSDPASFVYGIDFNNNAQPDFRENDDHPDYPIRRDQRGYHTFLKAHDPLPGLRRVSAGWYDVDEIAGHGEARALYARMQGRWTPAAGVGIDVDDDLKLVKDSIRDDVYEWAIGDTARLANVNSVLVPPPPDPLVMRNSLVNSSSMRLTYQPTAALRLRTDILHFLNRQRQLEEDGVLVQESDTFAEFSLISRAEYSLTWRKIELWTGAKYAIQEGHRGPAWNDSSLQFFAPIVKTSFEIMPGMSVQWGTSGLPGLPMRFEDGKNDDRSFDERKMVFMLSGRNESYQGSVVSMHTGIQFHEVDYDQGDRTRDFDTFTIFVDLIIGS